MFVFILGVLGLSVDCPDIINFAIGLSVNIKQPALMSQLRSDCCSQVTCDSNNRVTIISWNNMNLNGTINGTALPAKLLELHVFRNQLVGKLPSIWPPLLKQLDIDGNYLGGDVPLFPDSLNFLCLGWPDNFNYFTGTVKIFKPTHLWINNNWITDIQIADTSLLADCDLSNNPLLGNPNVASLNMCIRNNLYNSSNLPITTKTSGTQTMSKTRFSTFLSMSAYKYKSTLIHSISTYKSAFFHSVTTFKSSIPLFSSSKITNTVTLSSHSKDAILTISGKAEETASLENQTSLIIAETEPSLHSKFYFATETNEYAKLDTMESLPPWLIYGLLGAIVGLCVLVLLGGLLFKHPKMHSKFGRKNSFGTLNTVNTSYKT